MSSILEVILNLVDNLSDGVDSAGSSIDGLENSVEAVDSSLDNIDPGQIENVDEAADAAGVSVESVGEAAAMAGSGISDINPAPIAETKDEASGASNELDGMGESTNLVTDALSALAGVGIAAYISSAVDAAGNFVDSWSRIDVAMDGVSDGVQVTQATWGGAVSRMKTDTGRGAGLIRDFLNMMGTAGVTNEDVIVGSFDAIAGAAFVTKTPLETIENSFKRVVQTGKGFPRMMMQMGINSDTVLKATGKSVEQLSKEFKDMTPEARAAMLTMILNAKYGTEANKAYKYSWERVKDSLGLAFDYLSRVIGALVLPIAIPAMELLTNILGGAADAIEDMNPVLKAIGGAFVILVSGVTSAFLILTPLIHLLGPIFLPILENLSIMIAGAGGGISGLIAVLDGLLASLGPVGWAIILITSAIMAGLAIWTLWGDQIMKLRTALLSGDWSTVGKMLQNSFNIAKDAVYNFVTGAIGYIRTFAVQAGHAILDFIINLPGILASGKSSFLDFALNALLSFNNLNKWIFNSLSGLISQIPGILAGAATYFIENGSNMVDWLIQGLESASSQLDSVLSEMLTEEVESSMESVAAAAESGGETAGTKGGKSLITRFMSWIDKNGPKLLKLTEKIFAKLLPLLFKVFAKLVTVLAAYLWRGGINMGLKFLNGILTHIKQIPSRVWNYLNNVILKVKGWINLMYAKGKEAGLRFITAVILFVSQLPGKISKYLSSAYNSLKKWATNVYNKAKSAGMLFLTGITSFVSQLPGRISRYLSSAYNSLKNWATNAYKKAKSAGQNIYNGISKAISGIAGMVWDELMVVAKTITNAAGQLYANAYNVGKKIYDGLKNALGIQSPGYIYWMVSGEMDRLGTLLTDSKSVLGAKAGALGDGIVSGFDLSKTNITGAISAGGNGDTNFYFSVDLKNVPKETSKEEIKQDFISVLKDPNVNRQLGPILAQAKSRRKRNLGG